MGRLLFPMFFFSSRRRHTRWTDDWSSDVCSSDLGTEPAVAWSISRRRAGNLLGSKPIAFLWQIHQSRRQNRNHAWHRESRRRGHGAFAYQNSIETRSEERRVGKEERSRR